MLVKLNYLCALMLTLTVALVRGQELNKSCNVDSDAGICMALKDCPEVYSILEKGNGPEGLSSEDTEFLRKKHCGFDGNTPLVCCSNVKITSNIGFDVSYLLPDPDKGECGIDTSNRIYGGEITLIDEYPWMVLLRYKKPGNRFGFHCGGVLINSNYVLTASHCVNGRDIPVDWSLHQVRLGEHTVGQDPDCDGDDCAPTPQDILIEERIPHPNYIPTSRNQVNDIALLRLSSQAVYSDFVKPICLPRDPYLIQNSFVGQSMDVAGWGKTESVSASNVKLKVRVNGVSKDSCNAIYRRQNVQIGDSQICAGGEKGKDSCRGDSGGPLVALNNRGRRPYWFLVGLVSFGPSPCGMEGWPGVYTRCSSFVDWISQTIRP
ncbi:CLIP domain-containing serine protease [Sergentomyia squamirostris]